MASLEPEGKGIEDSSEMHLNQFLIHLTLNPFLAAKLRLLNSTPYDKWSIISNSISPAF